MEGGIWASGALSTELAAFRVCLGVFIGVSHYSSKEADTPSMVDLYDETIMILHLSRQPRAVFKEYVSNLTSIWMDSSTVSSLLMHHGTLILLGIPASFNDIRVFFFGPLIHLEHHLDPGRHKQRKQVHCSLRRAGWFEGSEP